MLAIVAATLVSGCATRAAPPASADDAQATKAFFGDLTEEELALLSDDQRARVRAYIRAVEAQADKRNMQVLWVNPPDPEAIADIARLREILRRNPPRR
ncbi:MAG: hypothetical protein OXR73_22170 [Myxococcales bacterium]|nr:hypothetical protein [Myxococcales bacterium]